MHLSEYQIYANNLTNKNIIFNLRSKKEMENILVEIAVCARKMGVNLEEIAKGSLDELVSDKYES